MRRELPCFLVDGRPGGDQERFRDITLRIGGCAAVTACDCCISLALFHGMERLCPEAAPALSGGDYEAFVKRMKPHLHPTWHGIDRLERYTEGFGAYLLQVGERDLDLKEFGGERSEEEARTAVVGQIEAGLPVPFLMLRCRDRALSDYTWHWFLLTGYEDGEGDFSVRMTSYGRELWVELRRIWDTGYPRKGGMILLSPAPDRT